MRLAIARTPKKIFVDEMGRFLPILYENFVRASPDVIHHPRRLRELHQMRLRGKVLRYAMEDVRKLFGKEFHSCTREIRNMVDLLGVIHEADVLLTVLREHLREMVAFNTLAEVRQRRILTGGVRQILSSERTRRKLLFDDLSGLLRPRKINLLRRRLKRALHLGLIFCIMIRATWFSISSTSS